MRFRTSLFVLLAAAGSLAHSQDAGPTYNIELIVFRATTAQGGAEDWSAESAASDNTVAGAESGSGSSVGHVVSALPTSQFQLTDIENKLRASGAYQPLAHVAWSQSASAWGTRAGFPVQKLGIDVPGLSGTVFLERGQYLHLGVALNYAEPDPP